VLVKHWTVEDHHRIREQLPRIALDTKGPRGRSFRSIATTAHGPAISIASMTRWRTEETTLIVQNLLEREATLACGRCLRETAPGE
jgi:hypothetical protein